jgi:hypothetical protein
MCAVKIGEEVIVVDATNKFLPYNILDKNLINGNVLVFNKKEYQWLELKKVSKNQFIGSKAVTLSENGQIITEYQLVYKGYYAEIKRNSFSDYTEKSITEYYLNDENVDTAYFINLKDVNKDLITGETVRSLCENDCKYLYYKPINIPKYQKNPFNQEKRELPVNFIYPLTEKYIFNLFYDSCYIIDEIPENLEILLPNNGGIFKYQSAQSAGRVQILVDFKIAETHYPIEDYELLKAFFTQMVAKLNENIVILRIEE